MGLPTGAPTSSVFQIVFQAHARFAGGSTVEYILVMPDLGMLGVPLSNYAQLWQPTKTLKYIRGIYRRPEFPHPSRYVKAYIKTCLRDFVERKIPRKIDPPRGDLGEDPGINLPKESRLGFLNLHPAEIFYHSFSGDYSWFVEYWNEGYMVSWAVIPDIDQQNTTTGWNYIFKISPHEEMEENISTDWLVNWPNPENKLQPPPELEKKNHYHESN